MAQRKPQASVIKVYSNTELHPGQQKVFDCPARFVVVDCGRRFGKTELAKVKLSVVAGEGWPVAYMAPSYKMLDEVWRGMKALLAPAIAVKDEQQRRLELITGGSIDFWSLVDPDSPRGRKYKFVVVDEAALLKSGEIWNASIRPTLMDMQGGAWFLSTPKGHNWFWVLYGLGLDPLEPEWACFKMPTLANTTIPGLDKEVEAARRNTPAKLFSQEYEADFISDEGAVFRFIRESATAKEQFTAIDGHQYFIGVDLAKSTDFSCFSVVDMNDNSVVYIDRSTQVNYTVQKDRLVALAHRFRPIGIVVEKNANLAFMEQLQGTGLPIIEFQTSGPSKMMIIEHLAAAFDNHNIRIIPDDVLINELEAFEMERLASGMFRYAAPVGFHDDTVMSIALAWWGATWNETSWAEAMLV